MKRIKKIVVCVFAIILYIRGIHYLNYLTHYDDCFKLCIIFLNLYLLILFVIYFSFCKLENFFKQQESKLDIIFLYIFFVSLFIPTVYINNNSYSSINKRPLADYDPFFLDTFIINYDFFDNFNKWFSDRFFLRKKIVCFYNYINLSLNGSVKNIMYDKKTDFMYAKGSGFNEFLYVDEKSFKKNFNPLYEFNSWCKKHNIKLYILIVPSRAMIYKPYKSHIADIDTKHKKFLDYINKIKKESDLKIIYPYYEMYKEKDKNWMFFKTEHHWTDDGAFIGYKALMKEITKDYNDIKILNKNDFYNTYNNKIKGDFSRKYKWGENAVNLGVGKIEKYHDIKYRYYNFKNKDKVKIYTYNTFYHKGRIFNYKNGANYRLIQLGTSQNENLSEFISPTFKDTKMIRINNIKNMPHKEEYKILKNNAKEILDYKPNILVFCIYYPNIIRLHSLMNVD